MNSIATHYANITWLSQFRNHEALYEKSTLLLNLKLYEYDMGSHSIHSLLFFSLLSYNYIELKNKIILH